MGAFIAQQPNGLYCRFSSIVDCPTHINMTREDYVSNFTGTVLSKVEGEDIICNYINPFSEVIEQFIPNNMTQEAFDELLNEMTVDANIVVCPRET